MTLYSLLLLSISFTGVVLMHGAIAYTFNTSYDTQNNGQLINPAEQLKGLGATPACLNAYVAEIDCDPELFNLTFARSEAQFTKENLDKACTKTCEVALAKWIVATYAACQNQPDTVTLFDAMNTPDLTMLHYYRAFCTQDLNNGTYCLTEKDPVYLDVGTNYTTEEINAACADTCFTQNSAEMWSVYTAINNTQMVSLQNVADACPKVDTKNYEILRPVADVASSGTTTATTTSTSVSETTSSTSNAAATATSSVTTTAASSTGSSAASALPSVTPKNEAASYSRIVFPFPFLIMVVTFIW